MTLENIDFNNERSEDCVLIDTRAWIQNPCMLSIHRMSGRDVNTYITKVLRVNEVKEALKGVVKEGDTILLSRVAAEVAPCRAFALEVGEDRYYHAPILQVVGTFENDTISFETLRMGLNRVLVKKVEPTYETFLLSPNDNTFIGEVVKASSYKINSKWDREPLQVLVGDKVIIPDNVSTEIYLDGEKYYAVEESLLVGTLNKTPYTLAEANLLNGSILMKPYVPGQVLNSTLLLTPDLNYEDADYTDIYNRNLFQVVACDSNLTDVSKDDILLVLRDITNYVYFNMEKYFIIRGMEFVEAKVKE